MASKVLWEKFLNKTFVLANSSTLINDVSWLQPSTYARMLIVYAFLYENNMSQNYESAIKFSSALYIFFIIFSHSWAFFSQGKPEAGGIKNVYKEGEINRLSKTPIIKRSNNNKIII